MEERQSCSRPDDVDAGRKSSLTESTFNSASYKPVNDVANTASKVNDVLKSAREVADEAMRAAKEDHKSAVRVT